jgi:ribokinase
LTGKIIVVGSLNMDLVVTTPRAPQVGETILGESFNTYPGGKGANQAVAAARLGAAVSMIGKLGQDAFGDQLFVSLQSNHVSTEWVLRDADSATGIALITVDARGDNSIIVVPGSNIRLNKDEIDRTASVFNGACLLLLQLEIPIDTNLRAAQIAHQYNVKVILNPAPAQALPQELQALVDILVVNESETALLSGERVDSDQALLAAAGKLKQTIAGDVVLTLGEQGCLWIGESEILRLPAYVVRAVDTTAAGDAFIAGMAVALAEDRPMAAALQWGNAAGALTVTRQGAQSSLPTREQVEDMLTAGKTHQKDQRTNTGKL